HGRERATRSRLLVLGVDGTGGNRRDAVPAFNGTRSAFATSPAFAQNPASQKAYFGSGTTEILNPKGGIVLSGYMKTSSLFSASTMPSALEDKTFVEVWVYVSALVVSLTESWPKRPSNAPT